MTRSWSFIAGDVKHPIRPRCVAHPLGRVLILILVAWVFPWPAAAAGRKRAVRPRFSPVITRMQLTEGSIAGDFQQSIGGRNFTPSTRVTVDGRPISNLTIVSSERIDFRMPSHVNGFVPIVVENNDGRAVAEFFYAPPPLDSLPRGFITTVAGIGKYVGEGRSAREVPIFAWDFALAPDGSVYLAEPPDGGVRRVMPDGFIERVAGTGLEDPRAEIGDGGKALDAALAWPNDVKIGPDGAVYIVAGSNNRIARVDPRTKILTTVAGSGPNGEGTYGGDGGPATKANLNSPNQVAFDSAGDMYILDVMNARIRRVDRNGIMTTFAGTGIRGFSGDGGPATAAQIDPGPNLDFGVLKIDGKDNVYLADVSNRRIRRIDAMTRNIDTVVGRGNGLQDGVPAQEVQLDDNLRGIAIDAEGRLYFTDSRRIRRVDHDGRVRTFLGGEQSGYSPDGTTAAEIRLMNPGRMEFDRATGDLYFVYLSAFRLCRLDHATQTIQTVAGIWPHVFGENGPGARARLENWMWQIALLDGDPVFGDGPYLRRLRSDGTLQTLAGSATALWPQFSGGIFAAGVAVDRVGNIFICSNGVARISPDGVYTSLTQQEPGFGGDGGLVGDGLVDNPTGLALDSKGNLYIADTYNHRIRRIDGVTGIISTVTGNAPPHPPNVPIVPEPSTGDGGPASEARVQLPYWIAVDGQDRLYVADTDRIRRIDSDGVIRTVVPSCMGPLTSNSRGEVFVLCDDVRRITGTNQWSVVAPLGGSGPTSGDGGPSDEAVLGANGFAVGEDGTIYVTDLAERRVRAIKGNPS